MLTIQYSAAEYISVTEQRFATLQDIGGGAPLGATEFLNNFFFLHQIFQGELYRKGFCQELLLDILGCKNLVINS